MSTDERQQSAPADERVVSPAALQKTLTDIIKGDKQFSENSVAYSGIDENGNPFSTYDQKTDFLAALNAAPQDVKNQLLGQNSTLRTLAKLNEGYDFWSGKIDTPFGQMYARDAEQVFTNLAKENIDDITKYKISKEAPVAQVNTGNAIHTLYLTPGEEGKPEIRSELTQRIKDDKSWLTPLLFMATLPFGGVGGLGSALSGGALTGMGASALGGAVLGGASSAIQGGNILKGALTGGITSVLPSLADQLIGSIALPTNPALIESAVGSASHGVSSAANTGIAGTLAQQGLSPTAAQALASGIGRGLQGAATAALTGKDVGAGALSGAVIGGATPLAAPAVAELTKAGVPIDLAKAGVVGTIGGLGSLATGKGFEAGALPAGVGSLVSSASKQVGFDKIPAPFRAVAEQGITSGLLNRPFNTEQALQNATLNYALSNTVGPQGLSALNMANTMYQATRPRRTLTPTQMSALRKFQAWKASRP